MQELLSVKYSFLIPLLPLLAAMISGFLGAKWLKGRSHWPIWLGVGASAALSIKLLIDMLALSHSGAEAGEHAAGLSIVWNYFTWISAGDFKAQAGFFFDSLTATMLCVVCGIGFLITIFSAGYMKGEAGYFRFFAYLGLFIFAMTCLVMGENLIMLYLGWEGVGLCSYLLIGYYYDKPSAREAAKKAFLVNRVGDFGFAIGIMLAYWAFGTVSYFGQGVGTGTGLLEMAAQSNLSATQQLAMQWIPFCLMIGAFGKSAQFPLYVWLPDAMEGPTPVSALIHAATMVTAGVYLIARCGVLFVTNQPAMVTVTVVGAFTALLAASIALRQFDLKKVFAYSTVSQLGFMFVGVGTLASVPAVFHLITHAFFKALLFLGSGVVMHAMLGELDMRKFSGLKRKLPLTRVLMLIGCLALSGFPLLAGFFSKDEIVASAWIHSKFLGLVMLFTAFLTAYYTFRLYFRVFEGPEVLPPAPETDHGHGPADAQGHADAAHGQSDHAGDHAHHNHEPALMMVPLIVLAVGALLAGYLNFPKENLGEFLGRSPSLQLAYEGAAHHYGDTGIAMAMGQVEIAEDWAKNNATAAEEEHSLHLTMMIVSGFIAVAGIFLAYQVHLKDRARAERLAASAPILVAVLENKYWIDEIYHNGIVEPLRDVGQAFFAIDQYLIDGVVWLLGFVPQVGGFTLKKTVQRGYLQGYAAAMLFGVAAILIVVLL